MVFSTVQISMPGTSCASALPNFKAQGSSNKDAAKTIRLIIKAPIDFVVTAKTAKRCFQHRVNGPARKQRDILQPHSRAEICSHGCDDRGVAEQPPVRARSIPGES